MIYCRIGVLLKAGQSDENRCKPGLRNGNFQIPLDILFICSFIFSISFILSLKCCLIANFSGLVLNWLTFTFQKCRSKLKALYMYDGGFYTYSIFALMFWETRRSDFGVSMSHHVATAFLIVLSYIFRLVY